MAGPALTFRRSNMVLVDPHWYDSFGRLAPPSQPQPIPLAHSARPLSSLWPHLRRPSPSPPGHTGPVREPWTLDPDLGAATRHCLVSLYLPITRSPDLPPLHISGCSVVPRQQHPDGRTAVSGTKEAHGRGLHPTAQAPYPSYLGWGF